MWCYDRPSRRKFMARQLSFFDAKTKFKIDKPIRLIELFAGVGAQAKALDKLKISFERHFVCEIDERAISSYNAVHGTNFKPIDIRTVKADDLKIEQTEKYCYVLTYSFPCQSISLCRTKREALKEGAGSSSSLLWEVKRILSQCKKLPQVLLLENVVEIYNGENGKHFREFRSFLEGIGYKNYHQILNSKNYGIPQNRKRCFMVSILGDFMYEFPEPIPLERTIKDFLQHETEKKYFLGEKAIKYITNPKRAGKWTKLLSGNEKFLPVAITANGNKNWTGQFVRVFNNGVEKIRKLTPKECWLFMGFSESDFERARSAGAMDTHLYEQAGNSIVVDVLFHIFKNLL